MLSGPVLSQQKLGESLFQLLFDRHQLLWQTVMQLFKQLFVQFNFLLPGSFVYADDGVEFVLAERQAVPSEFIIFRGYAKEIFLTCSLAFNAIEHPLEHAHILAIAWPDKFALGIFAEPIDALNGWQFCPLALQLGTHV